jgi:hypothetical protein
LLKVCIDLPTDDPNVQRFVPRPQVNVSEGAEKAGFNLRVEYPNENIAKYYKVKSIVKEYSYSARLCARDGGILASPQNTEMAKVSTIRKKPQKFQKQFKINI